MHPVSLPGNRALGEHMCLTYRTGRSVYHLTLSVTVHVLLTSRMQKTLGRLCDY
jgi:hypothetical protein